MVFLWSLSDSKSPQVSKALLSILAVLNNDVVWMVSTRMPTSKSFSPLTDTVPKAPITIGIIVTFMFHSFFNSLARSRYLSLFSHSFSFILWSAGTAKLTILQILFFFLLIDIRSGLLGEIRWYVCISKSKIIIIIIIIISSSSSNSILLLPWKFFSPLALADGFSLGFERRQVFSSA